MPSPARRLARLAVATAAGALIATALPATTAPAAATHGDLPPGRKLVRHTVQPGDTATGLAVRYHAWTRELISFNHLGSDAVLRVGQRITVPVVRAAVARERRRESSPRRDARPHARPDARPSSTPQKRAATRRTARFPDRAQVRRVIAGTARRHGVDPQLALAVSWQEAGWRMHHVSSANAIGAMQVLPATGRWMSIYAGRPLHLRTTRDNALAGVLLLKVLDDHTRSQRRRIAAYYQGLGAVREHGLYEESKRYVANVQAIKRRLERGLPPA